MRYRLTLCLLCLSLSSLAQKPFAAYEWADSVYRSLSDSQRIGQLIVARLSAIDTKTRKITFYDSVLTGYVDRFNIGGLCLFQGSPTRQVELVNALQARARTPILVSMDAEWGVGMRLGDSVMPLPKQMMLGAAGNEALVYAYGKLVAAQCRRMGILMNYAPVVDVNNNPNNPVINDRSFGENKQLVIRLALQYMKGLQESGVMACAKHFPGHGDVAVDSHFDLPVIQKSRAQLDSLELEPFRALIASEVASVMVGHLFIPAIDDRLNRPSSLSGPAIQGLLQQQLRFPGLTITDALEMQGVKKFYPDGEASVESIKAGNDMLCLPENIPVTVSRILQAIEKKELSWDEIERHVKKILLAKYQYGLTSRPVIATENLLADLNQGLAPMRRQIAEQAITLLSHQDAAFFPLKKNYEIRNEVAYVAIGVNSDNAMSARLRQDFQATVYYVDPAKPDAVRIDALLDSVVRQHRRVLIGLHNMSRSPASNFGITPAVFNLVNQLQQQARSMTFVFGNPYAARNWCYAANLAVCYDDDSLTQQAAVDLLEGKLPYKGTLPVRVCENFPVGYGAIGYIRNFPVKTLSEAGMNPDVFCAVDSIANDAIRRKATPGCMLLVAKDGNLVYEKGYGYETYEGTQPINNQHVYDLASITKVAATTLSIMKLYEQGKIRLDQTLGELLPWVKGSNKDSIRVRSLLLHEAGLSAFIPFYKGTIDGNGVPLKSIYAEKALDNFCVPVADRLFLRIDWADTLYRTILNSPVGTPGNYLYSDNDFIFLGKVVEAVSGMSLDAYVRTTFYQPMSLENIGFLPLRHIARDRIVPTEWEKTFRRQLLQGNVHDPGAAMFGGVAGHAGLFSNAYDLACLMQMLLNGGTWNGRRYLNETTIQLFTAYQSAGSRRGLGFDKPEKDNATRNEPYPTASASPRTFGHTGFTGTCVWADPDKNLIYIFLSNRVHPNGSSLLNQLNVRPKIHEAIYRSIQ